jgi:uncharacterized protein YqeY
MTITDRITEDMKSSMREATAGRTGTLRLLRSALKNEEIKLGHVLNDDEALKVLQREGKQRRDAMTQYNDAGRPELVAQEESELAIIAEYLPTAMSEAEVAAVVDEVIAETGASSMAQMGMVIGGVMKRVGARAEGGLVSRLVKEKLSV